MNSTCYANFTIIQYLSEKDTECGMCVLDKNNVIIINRYSLLTYLSTV